MTVSQCFSYGADEHPVDDKTMSVVEWENSERYVNDPYGEDENMALDLLNLGQMVDYFQKDE